MQPTIIGIAGASGAGKSVLANQLLERLRVSHSHSDAIIIHEDCYYRDRSELTFHERNSINYDHPDAMEHDLLFKHLNSLRDGHAIELPRYDYIRHTRKKEALSTAPSRIVIVEGILILRHFQLRDLMDLMIFVDVPLDICLLRRLRRDMQERGRTVESVLAQHENTVRPMYYEFIEPTRQYADLIVPHGGQNRIALEVLCSHLHRVLHAKTSAND